MKKIKRLLSVTSLLQLMLGLTSLKQNSMATNIYDDYLVINNVMVHDNAAAGIKEIAKLWPFVEIVDFRSCLNEFNSKMSKMSRIKWVCGEDFKAYQKLRKELFKLLQTEFIDEIYLRYKIGFPERLLLDEFSCADLILFEDGLGDYMPAYQLMPHGETIKMKFKKLVKRQLYNVKKDTAIKSFMYKKLYSERVTQKFSLIEDLTGHLKNQHLKNGSAKPYVNFKKEFLLELNNIKSKKWSEIFKGNQEVVIFLLYNLFLQPGANVTVEKELLFYDDIIKKIKKGIPHKKIIIKAHPNTPEDVCRVYEDRFGKMFRKDLGSIPGEILLVEKNVTIVIGAISSLLIYAKNVFGKKAFFYEMPFDLKTNQHFYSTAKETMKRLGVQEICL